ncbi:MAG TPA: hypothetical protein PLT82_05130 [Candidatus Hydrogenedens sp.]|nr:hypothetical protein [Candidatus Hydrogenedens sp.]HOL18706.1 hypothetical protein [Candidatus Hydrogenedens sp.]HPP58497.1 hypothetical protein [Candidatus Hydrogenedens sp.]
MINLNKRLLLIIIITLLSLVISLFVGYRATYFLITTYVPHLTIPEKDLNAIREVWVSTLILSKLLLEYHIKTEDKENTPFEIQQAWINNTFSPLIYKIRENVLQKIKTYKNAPPQINNLYKKFIHLCERIQNMLQFPNDNALKKAIYQDFYQYLKDIDELVENKNIKSIIPVEKTILEFEKVL